MKQTAEPSAGRGTLTRAAVVDRAVELADAEGLGAVTVRRLTHELGVTPMALYWHFRNKQELLAGVADRALAEIDLATDSSPPWPDQLAALLGAMVATLRAHPWIPALLALAEFQSSSYLAVLERMLEILRQAGFPAEQATRVAWQALRTAVSLVGEQPGGAAHPHGDGHEQARREVCARLQALPPERFPRIVEAAEPLSRCDVPDADLAVGILLAGIRALAPGRGQP